MADLEASWDFASELIKAVKKRPCLYSPNHPYRTDCEFEVELANEWLFVAREVLGADEDYDPSNDDDMDDEESLSDEENEHDIFEELDGLILENEAIRSVTDSLKKKEDNQLGLSSIRQAFAGFTWPAFNIQKWHKGDSKIFKIFSEIRDFYEKLRSKLSKYGMQLPALEKKVELCKCNPDECYCNHPYDDEEANSDFCEMAWNSLRQSYVIYRMAKERGQTLDQNELLDQMEFLDAFFNLECPKVSGEEVMEIEGTTPVDESGEGGNGDCNTAVNIYSSEMIMEESEKEQKCSDKIFLMSLHADLASLPPLNKCQAKLKLMKVIYESKYPSAVFS